MYDTRHRRAISGATALTVYFRRPFDVQKQPPSGPTTGWTRPYEAADGGIGPQRRSHDPWAPRPKPKSRPGCVS